MAGWNIQYITAQVCNSFTRNNIYCNVLYVLNLLYLGDGNVQLKRVPEFCNSFLQNRHFSIFVVHFSSKQSDWLKHSELRYIFSNATLEQKLPQCKANGDFNVHYQKTSAGGSDFELLICFSNIGRTDSQGRKYQKQCFFLKSNNYLCIK